MVDDGAGGCSCGVDLLQPGDRISRSITERMRGGGWCSPSPWPSPPGRGRSFCRFLEVSLGGDSLQHGQIVLPLLGERAGVRASVLFDRILTAKTAKSRSLGAGSWLLAPGSGFPFKYIV